MNDPYVLSIVAKGNRLCFTSPPLLLESPWEIRSPQGQDEIQGMREQVSLMLQKNAITEIALDSPGFYSNLFLVRKASGGWRPVIDLKRLNTYIHAPHFHMFTISSVLSTIRKGDYAFKIDGGFPNFRYLDPFGSPASHQLFGAQGSGFGPSPLGYSAPEPQCFDGYKHYNSSLLYQQTRMDPFPIFGMPGNRSLYVASGS